MFAPYKLPKSYTSRLGSNAKKLDAYYWNEPVDSFEANGWARKGDKKLFLLAGYAYLGLVKETEIIEKASSSLERFGLGAYASRIMGTISLHEELESLLSETNSTDHSIIFPSGYQTNLSVISALATEHDVVFSDALNHASIIDGCRLSGAKFIHYNHCDIEDLREKISCSASYKNRIVITDAVFSMDGDIAPIPEIVEVCREFNALLIIDEAHSFGVLGERGFGITEHFNTSINDIGIITGVLSKAIPGGGGYASGSERIITFLKENARGYIFSGALSPFHTSVAIESILHMRAHPELVKKLQFNTALFHAKLKANGVNIGRSSTPITPIIIGDAKDCVLASKYARDNGINLFAVPFPVVPMGTSRLRASVSAGHRTEDLKWAATVIGDIVSRFKASSAADRALLEPTD